MRLALLAIVLLLPLASALPLQARVDDARLVVELGAGLPPSFDVVISHSDARAWIDRIAHVDKGSAPNATLRLDGLPHEVALTVRVMNASSYPALAGAPSYLDGAAIANMPSIAEASVAPIPAGAGDHVVAIDVGGAEQTNLRWINVAPDGTIALTFIRVSPSNQLSVAFVLSHDAGHTWTAARIVSPERANEPTVRTTIDGDGKLVILYESPTYVNNGASSYTSFEPWHFVRVDPASGEILSDHAFTIDGQFFQLNDGGLAPGPGKGSTLAWVGGYATLDSSGRESDYRNGAGAHVALLTEDGTGQALPDIPSAPDSSSSLRIASAPSGVMAVVGTSYATVQNISMRGWVATSPSGPHLFGNAQNVTTSFIPTFDTMLTVTSATVDDSRNVRATFVSFVSGQPASGGYEVAVAPDASNVAAIDLRGMTPRATGSISTPAVAMSGRVAWLTWGSDNTERWLARSVDSGSTWSAPVLLKQGWAHDGFDLYGFAGLAILPDGRPAIEGGWGGIAGAGLPFDPRPLAAAHLDDLYLAPEASAPSGVTSGLAIVGVEPTELVLSGDGTSPINVTFHNSADHDITATLAVSSSGGTLSVAPGAIDVHAGETLVLAGVLELDPPSQPGGSAQAQIVASADDGTIVRSAPLRVAWPGAPQVAPQPTAAPAPPSPSILPPPSPVVVTEAPPEPVISTPHTSAPADRIPAPPLILVAAAVAMAAILRRATFK